MLEMFEMLIIINTVFCVIMFKKVISITRLMFVQSLLLNESLKHSTIIDEDKYEEHKYIINELIKKDIFKY